MDRERMREVIKQVSAMTPAEREALAAKCPILNTEGHMLSAHNIALICYQGGGNATVVGGFKQWLRQGRCVQKGQHGYSILYPVFPKRKQEEEEEAGDSPARYSVGYVFDISQTAELPVKGNPAPVAA